MKRFVCLNLCLAFVIVTLTLAGCGGVKIVPIGAKVQNADRKYDRAEAYRIKADRDEERDKWREEVAKKKALYDDALNAYVEIIEREPTGKYSQRSHYQIAEIYKKRYAWDKATEHYNAIVEIAPSGYYGGQAKSGIANIRKYRRLIDEKRRRYQNYLALYEENNAPEHYDTAAQALYDVADSYEQLGNYPEAIANYERMVEEFPEHEKAPPALTKIGYVHFYKLYDYQGGWPAYNRVIESYPDSYDATQAIRLLKDTDRTLKDIAQNQAEIKRYRSKKAQEYEKTGRKIMPSELYGNRYVDIVVQCFQFIGRRWEDLRNYPNAIVAYRTLADQLSYKKFAAADARYQIGRLYQLNGQLEQAIEAYQDLFDNNPESIWRNEGVYQQAVCFRGIREFAKAYEAFKAYMSLGRDVEYYREAEQIVRQFEIDQDGDGYKFYVEQEAGTSDRDPNDHPGAKS